MSGLQALQERFQLSAFDGELPLLQSRSDRRQNSQVLHHQHEASWRFPSCFQTSLCRPSGWGSGEWAAERRRSRSIPPPPGWPSLRRVPPSSWSRGGPGSLQPVRSERVLHSRVGQHQVAFQHVQSQRVHSERVVQGEGIHLEAGDVRQSAGDLLRQTRR